MSLHKIYNRYAKSLIEISQDVGELDATIENANYFTEVTKVRDFSNLLKNPVFKPEMKLKIIDSLFKGKVNDVFYKFLQLVIRKGRESLLPAIMNEVLVQNKKMNKITDISLTTAVDLPEEFLSVLRDSLQKASITDENLEIITKTDKSIIGGFIIQVEDKLIDSSIKNKLRKVEKNIIEDKYIRVI